MINKPNDFSKNSERFFMMIEDIVKTPIDYNVVDVEYKITLQNGAEIKTTAEQVLQSIINYAGNKLGDVLDGCVINYFEQQFADNCAGGWVNFNLEVKNELGDCMIDEYNDDNDDLINRLIEVIKIYEKDNEDLALLLKEILHKLTGEVID